MMDIIGGLIGSNIKLDCMFRFKFLLRVIEISLFAFSKAMPKWVSQEKKKKKSLKHSFILKPRFAQKLRLIEFSFSALNIR